MLQSMGVGMFRVSTATVFLPLALVGAIAQAEPVVKASFDENVSGHPCKVKLDTQSGRTFAMNLSDHEGWGLTFFVRGTPQLLSPYFNKRGSRDQDRLLSDVDAVRIGQSSFDLDGAEIWEIEWKKVDTKTEVSFDLETEHKVGRALQAMKDDGIQLGLFADISGTSEALEEFRICGLKAMGLSEGDSIETNYREEYRLIFEKSFKAWVTAAGRADGCLVSAPDDAEIRAVAVDAASAFVTGWLAWSERSDYEEDLMNSASLFKLTGLAEARTEGCLMAGTLVSASRAPVDAAIDAALSLDD
jgi:hypothetical protein